MGMGDKRGRMVRVMMDNGPQIKYKLNNLYRFFKK